MLRDKHIVIIDDTESIRNFLRISLEAHNATVDTAATASGGLALCEQSAPDLVVLDIGLPDHEGLHILPRLKRLKKNGHPTAVAILTVRKERSFIEKAKEMGADAYLIKPCFVEDVIEAIEKMFNITNSPYALIVPENVPALPGENDILLIKGH